MEALVPKDINSFAAYKKTVKFMSTNESQIQYNRNFGLSEIHYNEMAIKLKQGNEKLFEQAFLNHFERSMSYVIKKFNAEKEIAYDITMNTLLELRKRIIQGKVQYGNLNFLFTQMCAQRYKREMGRKIDNDTYTQVNSNNQEFEEETYEILDQVLSKMGEDCKSIIQDVYYNKTAYKEMETKYAKSASALRKQKERCITKLKMLIRQKLNHL